MAQTEPLNIQKRSHGEYKLWALVLIIVLVTAALRIRLLEIPLDRDEGGYAYTAQLILQGIPPFAEAYDIKMPGLYYVYALILLVFGQSTVGIHLGLMVINAATIVVMFLLGRFLLGSAAGIVTAAAYAALSLTRGVEGFCANAEHLLILPAVGGIFLMLRAIETHRLSSFFFSGLLLGMALVIKHQGMFFAAFAGVYLLLTYLKKPPALWKRYLLQYALFALAVIIPFGLLCVLFAYHGLFEKFWFWLFKYAREYTLITTFSQALKSFKTGTSRFVGPALLLLVLAAAGLASLPANKKMRRHSLFVLLFLIFSLASFSAGFYFRPHYFVLILPVVALLAAAGVDWITTLLANHKSFVIRKVVPVFLAAASILYLPFAERAYLFELSPTEISRMHYGLNPFVESVRIADYIRRNTSEDDTIAILGSEPQIFFYAGRRSASAHLYVHPLMGNHKYARVMQQEMIYQIEQARPKFFIFMSVPTSWLRKDDSEKSIFKWATWYRHSFYKRVGLVDIISSDETVYHWGRDAAAYRPRSGIWISVSVRKNGD